MKFGYVRISHRTQSYERQVEVLKPLVDKIYSDVCTGTKFDREGLKELLTVLREGDEVITVSFDRLGRKAVDMLNTIETIKSKGATYRSIKEGINTSDPFTSNLMMSIYGGIYEAEKEFIRERQAQGIAKAKAKGVYKSAKKYNINKKRFAELEQQVKEGKITSVDMARMLNISRSSLYRIRKENSN